MKKGTVYWITGLSNSGKTTLSVRLVAHLKELGIAAVHLDGDALRSVYGDAPDFSAATRNKVAFRNARLCALLSEQGISVVCSTISLFHDVQKWNRQNISSYKEIYLRAPLAVRQARDVRGIYSGQNVAGTDFAVEEPKNPELALDNDGSLSMDELFEKVRGLVQVPLPV